MGDDRGALGCQREDRIGGEQTRVALAALLGVHVHVMQEQHSARGPLERFLDVGLEVAAGLENVLVVLCREDGADPRTLPGRARSDTGRTSGAPTLAMARRAHAAIVTAA